MKQNLIKKYNSSLIVETVALNNGVTDNNRVLITSKSPTQKKYGTLEFKALNKENIRHLKDKPGVYCIVDLNNDQFYVGQSRNLFSRISHYITNNIKRGSAKNISDAYNSMNGKGFFILTKECGCKIKDKEDLEDKLCKHEHNLFNDMTSFLVGLKACNALEPQKSKAENNIALRKLRSNNEVVMFNVDTLEVERIFDSMSEASQYTKELRQSSNSCTSIQSSIKKRSIGDSDKIAYNKVFIVVNHYSSLDLVVRRKYKALDELLEFRKFHNEATGVDSDYDFSK